MAKFTYDIIESLDYDFTGIPSNDGKGMCVGKGRIPEPTQPQLEAYSEGIKVLYGLNDKDEANEAVQGDEKGDASTVTSLMALTAGLCQNSPSEKELDQLPPRAKHAFLKWIHAEMVDPKVSNGDTEG